MFPCTVLSKHRNRGSLHHLKVRGSLHHLKVCVQGIISRYVCEIKQHRAHATTRTCSHACAQARRAGRSTRSEPTSGGRRPRTMRLNLYSRIVSSLQKQAITSPVRNKPQRVCYDQRDGIMDLFTGKFVYKRSIYYVDTYDTYIHTYKHIATRSQKLGPLCMSHNKI